MTLRVLDAAPAPNLTDYPVWRVTQERRHDRKRTTRVEDRKYKAFDEDEKKWKIVARNHDRREGQTTIGLREWREVHGHRAVSGLMVLKGCRPQKSGYCEITKGAKVRFDGEIHIARGFASYGKKIYLGSLEESVPAKKCQRLLRNSGLLWQQAKQEHHRQGETHGNRPLSRAETPRVPAPPAA